MILKLEPSILLATPLGTEQTLFLIDYEMNKNTCWDVAFNWTEKALNKVISNMIKNATSHELIDYSRLSYDFNQI